MQATIATEDASFYRNPGVDGWAIARALYINWQGGEILSGGSTITQQLARNLLLSPQERREVSLTRKLREAILAWRLARTYSKDEILTLYLNETYYGNLAYGLEAPAAPTLANTLPSLTWPSAPCWPVCRKARPTTTRWKTPPPPAPGRALCWI